MWNEIKQVALSLVREDRRYANETEEFLSDWILSTGYGSELLPHLLTKDLLYVYAASLCNAGGRGPGFAPFAKMVSAAVMNFIVDNKVGEVSPQYLARACVEYLGTGGAEPLAKNGKVDYLYQLRQMAEGNGFEGKPVLPQLLLSVVKFIGLLCRNYGGSANSYHQSFIGMSLDGVRKQFVVEKYEEIANFPKVGVAVAMNFFKDSQVPAFRGQPLDHLYSPQIGWYVKPDKHILRLMLFATGRLQAARIDERLLFNLPDDVAFKLYANTEGTFRPGSLYELHQGRPSRERGQWNCIEDVHQLATQDSVPPLGFDRLLYLIGSGRYRHPNARLATPQCERYQRLIHAVRGCPEHPPEEDLDGILHPARDPRPPRGARRPVGNNVVVDGDEPNRPARDLFFEGINGVPTAENLISRLAAACEELNVEVHHTHTRKGDLRVRADRPGPHPRRQNIVTMAWVPMKGYFSCGVRLSPDDCIGQGLSPECVRMSGDALSSLLEVHPGIDDEAFLSIVCRSIQHFRG